MPSVLLRRTRPDDLDFILALEHRPDNREFIGRWTLDEHRVSMARADRQHLTIASADDARLGYLIAYDVSRDGYGAYIKRIAVSERARGVGRAALYAFAASAWTTGVSLVCLAVRPYNERARRCYRAVGFEDWTLSAPDFSDFLTRVDPVATDCVVMRLLPGGPAPARS